jgi:hypothetical protein
MGHMTKEHWLDAILEVVGDKAGTMERERLASMTRKQLVAVEFLVVAMRDDACQVGCGDCDCCDAKNAAAKAEYDRKNPVVGKLVRLLPMTKESRAWVRANGEHCKMLRRVAERFTVRAPNGRQRTFGPHDATWTLSQFQRRSVG